MIAALRSALSNHHPFGWLMASTLGAAIIIGAATPNRGPDTTNTPQMAEAPVQLPDGRALFVQRYEVTVAEWNACYDQGACAIQLHARPDHDPKTIPATGLNYVDVQDYVNWISASTGHEFRLPTSDEWEYMAEPVLPEHPDPIFTDPELTWASSYLVEGLASRALKPQGSFATSPEGIADLNGSVWEWTSDCYSDGIDTDRCPAFYVGGEHLAAMSFLIRDPARGGCAVGTPPAHLGLRLVSDVRL